MGIRDQNLETVAPVFASFAIHQTASVDDLKDEDIGIAVSLTANYEVGPAGSNESILGKLIALTLSDADTELRQATVQIGGILSLPITTTYPEVGNRVVGGSSGAVKQAPALGSNDPAGGNIARGIVLEVNGTSSCTVYLP